ncbi:hypothetical protein MNBD_ALPHA06-94 [hydrothermal vent metagenome]|uniref:Cell division protein FtsL n=1 Tax=hydrothermal vent metagenome TaxID=652676 RepID=A0A3B0S124_9ZZZZ
MIRILNLVALGIALILAAALYVAKNDAKHAQARLVELRDEVASARAAVQLLENEEAYLEAPDRLARLARTHLDLVPVSSEIEQQPEMVIRDLQAEMAAMVVEAGQ